MAVSVREQAVPDDEVASLSWNRLEFVLVSVELWFVRVPILGLVLYLLVKVAIQFG